MFSRSSTQIHLSQGHILNARCGNGRGETSFSSIDLNSHLGNSGGNLWWGSRTRGAQNFSRSAVRSWLYEDGDGYHLVSLLGDGNGGTKLSQIFLDGRIANISGILKYRRPEHIANDLCRLAEAALDDQGSSGGSIGPIVRTVVGLAESGIRGALSNAELRKFYSQGVASLVAQGYPDHTVVVIHPRCTKTAGWQHVGYALLEYETAFGGSTLYQINICPQSEKGERLVNQGDGGYLNWAVNGSFTKDGKTITTV